MQWKNILRWIAVIPSMIGGLVLGAIAINILSSIQRWFMGAGAESGWAQLTFWFFSSLAGGALAIYWGTKVAPSHRKIVALILGVLIVIFSVIAFLLARVYSADEGWFWPLISSVAMVIGAGYMVYQIQENKEEFEL